MKSYHQSVSNGDGDANNHIDTSSVSVLREIIGRFLINLCSFSIHLVSPIRMLLINKQILPEVSLYLTLTYKTDCVTFLAGTLNDPLSGDWFSNFLNESQNGTSSLFAQETVNSMRAKLLEELIKVIPLHYADSKENIPIVKKSVIIRLYTALLGLSELKATREELMKCVDLIISVNECKDLRTKAGIHFVRLCLCFILTCADWAEIPENFRVFDWIKLILSRANGDKGFYSTVQQESYSEMLLLIGIHFYTSRLSVLAQLVRSTIGFNVRISSDGLKKIGELFAVHVFSELVIGQYAVSVPCTSCLNDTMEGYLPVHCVYQLLKDGVFTKHAIPVAMWIFEQLQQCHVPCHAVFCELLEAFASSVACETNSRVLVDTITTEQINSIFFNNKNEPLTPQILLLFYMLKFNTQVLSNKKKGRNFNEAIQPYSRELLSRLPVRKIMNHLQRNQSDYTALYSSLFSLVISFFPHLLNVNDLLFGEEWEFFNECDLEGNNFPENTLMNNFIEDFKIIKIPESLEFLQFGIPILLKYLLLIFKKKHS
ncbi:integrator complex subunit 2-like [Zophobas morio]|uniref:integrator complex subunit 2-like n=1 Tax=Zophobas morio TaxID=2755281 RepID=UPI003083EB37